MLNKCLCPFLLAGLLGFTMAGRLPAAEPVKPVEAVVVEFSHPEKYTDLKNSSSDFDNADGAVRFLPLIRKYLVERAGARLAAGQKLAVTFKDIHLAGAFEPWHGPQMDDVRIIKDVYPPRLDFTYTLTDADGKVLKSGEYNRADMAFMMHITRAFADDPLRYEKEMLDDWLSDLLPSR